MNFFGYFTCPNYYVVVEEMKFNWSRHNSILLPFLQGRVVSMVHCSRGPHTWERRVPCRSHCGPALWPAPHSQEWWFDRIHFPPSASQSKHSLATASDFYSWLWHSAWRVELWNQVKFSIKHDCILYNQVLTFCGCSIGDNWPFSLLTAVEAAVMSWLFRKTYWSHPGSRQPEAGCLLCRGQRCESTPWKYITCYRHLLLVATRSSFLVICGTVRVGLLLRNYMAKRYNENRALHNRQIYYTVREKR